WARSHRSVQGCIVHKIFGASGDNRIAPTAQSKIARREDDVRLDHCSQISLLTSASVLIVIDVFVPICECDEVSKNCVGRELEYKLIDSGAKCRDDEI